MPRKTTLLFISFWGVLLMGLVGIAQNGPTEAPAGFDTPTLTPNESHSNGIPELVPGDTFALDQTHFEEQEDNKAGLGPVYNATSCVTCHQNPVTGGPSQITELRVGHRDDDGNFVNPTIVINDGADVIEGRSLVNDRAISPQAQEHVPDTENIRTRRGVLNTLGDGFVEAISDDTLMAIAENQSTHGEGEIHGEAIQVPILEAPGQTGVGRFGWKDQNRSLLSFAGQAYEMEIGISNRLQPKDATTVSKTTSDPEDTPDSLGMDDIDHFAQFMRGTKVPPRDETLAATPQAREGHELFHRIGCKTCHVESIVTAPPGTPINGGIFIVPEALGNKIIHPFGDFLLHDVGTGDGIVQTTGLQETADKMRTAPLWGLRTRTRFMHDFESLTLEDAIRRHRGEARRVAERFRDLTPREKQQLITFLNSLIVFYG